MFEFSIKVCIIIFPHFRFQKSHYKRLAVVCGAKEKTSQYSGVYWHNENDKWCAQIRLHRKKKFGGCFDDEVDAAKKVNQLCEDMGIPHKNPEISAIPIQQVAQLFLYDV